MSVWPTWQTVIHPRPEGPDVNLLHESAELKVVLVALEPGQALPDHPGPAACFHFLDGAGTMLVGEQVVEVAAGATVVVPSGAMRAVRASSGSALVFLGNLGDPASENGPH